MHVNAIHSYFHWLYHTRSRHVLFNVGSGAFYWLFLTVTLPFGIYETNVSYLVLCLYLLPLAFIWILISFSLDRLFYRFAHSHTEEGIRGDFILWIGKLALLVHVVFVIRGVLCQWLCLDLLEYLQSWLAFSLMFGFCYALFSLYARYLYFHNLLNNPLAKDGTFLLEGQGNERLKIRPKDIFLLEADDNYVKLHQVDAGSRKIKLIRITMSSIAVQLGSYPNFIRTHRSFIVNTHFYESYSRKENMLKLNVEGQKIDVPVSRKYKDSVEALFVHPK